MFYVILIIAFIVIMYLLLKPKNNVSFNDSDNNSSKKEEPRDFIIRANNWFDTSIPLRNYIDANKQEAINFLFDCLQSENHQDRKQAAYALGQIGDEQLLNIFENYISKETVKGVKEAMQACFIAIQMAPSDKGFTELHRRQIIDDVYYNRPVKKPII